MTPQYSGSADELSAKTLDDALVGCGHLLDLLRAHVLARQIDVFVQRHGMPFPCRVRSSGAKPFEPFGKAREFSEGGNTGRRTMRSCRPCRGTAVRSAPGRDRAEARGYSGNFSKDRPERRSALARGRMLRDGSLFDRRIRSATFARPSWRPRAVASIPRRHRGYRDCAGGGKASPSSCSSASRQQRLLELGSMRARLRSASEI